MHHLIRPLCLLLALTLLSAATPARPGSRAAPNGLALTAVAPPAAYLDNPLPLTVTIRAATLLTAGELIVMLDGPAAWEPPPAGCTGAADTLTCVFGPLAADTPATFTLTGRALAAGEITYTLSVCDLSALPPNCVPAAAATTVFAPIPLAAAQQQTGVVAVEGQVSVAPGTFGASEWAIQDISGGLAVYQPGAPPLALGERVRLVATRSRHNGAEQLGPPIAYFASLGPGAPLVARPAATGDLANPASNGWLVLTEGVIANLEACGGGYSFTLDDGSGPVTLYLDANLGLDLCARGFVNGDRLAVTGFHTSYLEQVEIKPRGPEDVRAAAIGLSAAGTPLVAAGGQITYTLSVRNLFSFPLTGIVLTDTLPAAAADGQPLDGGVLTARQARWEIGALAAGAAASVRLVVQLAPSAAGTVANTAYAVTATEWLTPTLGAPLVASIGERMPLHLLQGRGPSSPYLGQTIPAVGGVVTRLNNNGFFLQELTPDADADTSEGLFVAANAGFLAQIAIGQEVRLCGRVSERDGLTQLTAPEGLTLLGVRPLPPPSELRLPATPARLESLEGMLVTLPQTLTVSGNAYLGALGQLTLTGERAWQGTTDAAAGALILDDGRSTRNPAAVPYLDAAGTRRLGDTVATLLGVLDQGASDPYGGRGYRLHPIQPPTFAAANPRPLVPPRRGSLRVGALNLESYFNGDGDGNFTAERGASSPAEFARQRAQILALLGSLNADVLGLMEIENDSGPNSALADLLTGLNAGRAPTYVAAVGGDPGQDPIRVALIYRADRLIPLGPAYTCQEAAHPQYQPLYERPPLVQTLRQQGNGAVFSVIVSHFKSRRCDGATGVEQDTGAGCYAAKRQAQAEGLRRCLAAVQAQSGSPDVILVGDLNTYPGEVPLVSLTAAGWVDGLAAQLPPPERYSYVYAAQTGLLDYALLTPSLAPQLTAAAIWHVNADEPAFLDYTLADKPVAQIKQWRAAPFRASDHDPVLLDLRLAGTWHLFLPLTTKP